jgi:hypothetical protein
MAVLGMMRILVIRVGSLTGDGQRCLRQQRMVCPACHQSMSHSGTLPSSRPSSARPMKAPYWESKCVLLHCEEMSATKSVRCNKCGKPLRPRNCFGQRFDIVDAIFSKRESSRYLYRLFPEAKMTIPAKRVLIKGFQKARMKFAAQSARWLCLGHVASCLVKNPVRGCLSLGFCPFLRLCR